MSHQIGTPANSNIPKWVYQFGGGRADGSAAERNLLGGKGANLAEMASIGLPVPPGFTITTDVCSVFYKNDQTLPEDLSRSFVEVLTDISGRFLRKLVMFHVSNFFSQRSFVKIQKLGKNGLLSRHTMTFFQKSLEKTVTGQVWLTNEKSWFCAIESSGNHMAFENFRCVPFGLAGPVIAS